MAARSGLGSIRSRLGGLSGQPIEEVLRAPVIDSTPQDRLRGLLLGRGGRSGRQDDLAFAGLTVGDLLYDAVRVDPEVLKAVDFARAEDLSNVFTFTPFADRLEDVAETVRSGNLWQLQGHVAERIVAQELQSQGYEVEFPGADPRCADENARFFGGRRVRPPRKGSGSWAPGGIKGMLENERYRGHVI